MSFKAMAWAASVRTHTPTQKLILLLLADKANDDGFCWPRMNTIAEQACVTRQCVLENVKKLAALGWIQVEKRTIKSEETGNNHNIAHLYRVNVSKLPLVNEDDNPCKRGLQPLVNEDDNRTYQYKPINEPISGGAPASPSHPSFNSENRESENQEPNFPIEEKNYGKLKTPVGDSAAPPRKTNGNGPPSVEEVRAYTESRVAQGKPRINAETFVNFYQSKGWMVGKNKMKDWRAAVHTWEQKATEQSSVQKHNLKVSVPQMTKEQADRLRKRSETMMRNIVSKNPHNGRKQNG